MAEHSRSSGVFSRRRVAVNGFAAVRPPALVVTLCRAHSPASERWHPEIGRCVERRLAVPFRAPPNPHRGVCKSGALPKNWRQPRPVTAYAAETTTSLSPCSLSARQNVSVQVWSGTGVHLANFFLHNHLHCLSQHLLLLLPDHYLPLFCNRQKCPFRLFIFCADHLHGWRPYWSLSLPFLQLSKITNRT